MSGWMGSTCRGHDLDEPIGNVESNAIQSAVASFQQASDTGKEWTVGDIAAWGGIGGMGPVLVGSGESIADQLQSWVDGNTDVDGRLPPTPSPRAPSAMSSTTSSRRSSVAARTSAKYTPGTLRHKLFGEGDPGCPIATAAPPTASAVSTPPSTTRCVRDWASDDAGFTTPRIRPRHGSVRRVAGGGALMIEPALSELSLEDRAALGAAPTSGRPRRSAGAVAGPHRRTARRPTRPPTISASRAVSPRRASRRRSASARVGIPTWSTGWGGLGP